VACFLALPDSELMTGQTLLVDGGMVLDRAPPQPVASCIRTVRPGHDGASALRRRRVPLRP